MQISETCWYNFRNLKPRRLSWCSGLNLLIGRNGVGKTNMLEALNLSCGWGTFYNARANNLRSWNIEENKADNIEIFCEASGEEKFSIDITISSRISARMNNERVSFSELRTHIPALCFLPADMNLIDGTPSVRRVFIDKLCSIISIPYAKRLFDYKRLVRHRIKLLRIGKSPHITSQLMSSIGAWIWSVRNSVVKMLNNNVSAESSSKLSPFSLKMELKLGGITDSSEKSPLPDTQITQKEFFEKLELSFEKEIKSKTPLIGPHRDDLLISVCGNKKLCSSEFSPAGVLSRGQKRRVIISLILASGKVMESKLKRKPIFLLDEIFSELDDEAKQIVIDALFDTNWQIFATSTESDLSNWQGKVYSLSDGDIL